jgi:mannose-6-phosphate isomerase-like protein (cupin superfamily)
VALFDVARVQQRLEAGTGGYEIVHRSPGLEIGVYVLVAPEPDHQSPHEDDEVYVVLEGRGVLTSRTIGSPSRKGKRSSSRPAPSTASPATRA